MVFSSITFVYAFFPLVAAAYYLSKNRVYRNVVLLLASLLFYSWGEPRFLLLMLAATLAAYCGGLLMERCTAHRKLILIVTVVLLVGNLFVFKYLNFFSENLSALFGWSALPKLTLPIGISFYTFQILSYVIDLYRGEIRVQRNYFYLLLYVSFFPQLIAGPIVRYETVEQEIQERHESIDDVAAGLRRFILGLAKKGHSGKQHRPHRRDDLRRRQRRLRHHALLACRRSLCAADLFRFFRLQRHGHRSGADVRLPFFGEL